MYAVTQQTAAYALTAQAQTLVPNTRDDLAALLTQDAATDTFAYNPGYKPSLSQAGDGSRVGFSASFAHAPSKGVTVTDVVNEVSIGIKPKYRLSAPSQEKNRIIYPMLGGNIQQVYTAQSTRVKEDIILNTFAGDTRRFIYDLSLESTTEARLERNGSIGIYGVDSALLGSVSTATDQDAQLLQKARQKAAKNTLLFTIPAPIIKEASKKVSNARVYYELQGTQLTVVAENLKEASYPLSIDPTVYIETAAKLMRGNNETNTDFDVDNELIQKSQTTGARIDSWSSTTNLSNAVYGQGTAVAGGYIYSVGGVGSGTSGGQTFTSSGSFPIPGGVNYVTVKAWGGGGAGANGDGGTTGIGGAGGGGGYAKAVIDVSSISTLTVTVGSGGVAPGTSSSAGGDGGTYSRVADGGTTLLIAGGGGGGGGARGNNNGNGGAGGAGGGSTGVPGGDGSSTGHGSGGGGGTSPGGTAGAAGTGGAAGIAGTSLAGGNGAGFGGTCNSV
ncbi:hypothetical protein KDA14_01420, partial [Candidatus Saccharibacteria bacterium]|nr:hypothetical protein [Candidatus Saccharibacteria bacterium]